MSSRPRRYTPKGGFGKTHFPDDEGDQELDIDFSITESGRTVAHLIANMKDQDEDNMDFSITDSGGRSLDDTATATPAAAAAHIDFSISKSGRAIEPVKSKSSGRSTRVSTRSSAAKAIPAAAPVPSLLGPMDQDQPAGGKQASQSGSYESSGSAFVSGLMSHTPPTGSSYETRHFGKRARVGVSSIVLYCTVLYCMEQPIVANLIPIPQLSCCNQPQSVSGRLRSASDLEDKGIIDRNQKGILKDLIICGDEQLQEALDKYEKGDKSQLEGMIKSGALSQKLPADMDLLGELDLDFLTVDDATIGSMGHQNVEHSSVPNNTNNARSSKSLPHISFPSGSSVGGQSDDGIGELDLNDFAGNDSDSYLRYNSRSNSIDLDNFRSRSNSVVDSRDRSNSVIDGRDRSNSLAYGILQNEGRDRSNSLAYGILQNEPSADAAAAHQRWMDRAVPGKESISMRRGPNAPVAVSGIGASLAEYQNRVTAKPTKAQLAEEKKKERQLKKEHKEREKQEQKERKEQERREKREQKERDKVERKGKKTQKAKLKEEEAEEEEKIVQSGTGRPRSMSDPNISSTIDSNGLLQVERPEGWVGAYSPESRTIRIERFMEKRKHRVWTKSVKYDVRKNFADSRLRVKGRFVKKEDELLMRELMSLT
jgi:hypothetical protein